ncbi:MAG TPA: hypothetical protein VLE95_03375 [Chlamydiales bacterium]|nr:hypothetical protein [Chlamydiales bacterium]
MINSLALVDHKIGQENFDFFQRGGKEASLPVYSMNLIRENECDRLNHFEYNDAKAKLKKMGGTVSERGAKRTC